MTETILKREDGSKVKIMAKLSIEFLNGKRYWSTHVSLCAPSKRTFCGVYSSDDYTYRCKNATEREKFVREQQLKYATKEEIYEVMLAEWESIKPTIDQI